MKRVASEGYGSIKSKIGRRGIEAISEFPFMGSVTAYHLAKNIGIDVAKPDRHLERMAAIAGRRSAAEMCFEIAQMVGDKVSVVDLVLWRYATLVRDI